MGIIVAIEGREQDKDVVSIAYDLATAYDDTLVALHVVPNEEFESHQERLRDIPGFASLSITQEEESAADFARQFVREAVDDVEMDRIDSRGRVGDIGDEILAEADSVDPRFLVVGGRRRSPAGKALFGNLTQQILLNADCPVVTQLSEH